MESKPDLSAQPHNIHVSLRLKPLSSDEVDGLKNKNWQLMSNCAIQHKQTKEIFVFGKNLFLN
jgi:hypothetical protein